MTKNGMFIAVEGTDGAGKHTQTEILGRRLRDIGLRAVTIGFPHYASPTGQVVTRYLHGEFGLATEVDPYIASKFFADDRLASKQDIDAWLEDGRAVVTDRYKLSNDIYQGTKLPSEDALRDYWRWSNEQEFDKNGIPKPDLVIVLHVPSDIGIARAAKRAVEKGITLDDHEKDAAFLRKVERLYLAYAAAHPRDHVVISCMNGDKELGSEEISEKVWETVKEHILAQ